MVVYLFALHLTYTYSPLRWLAKLWAELSDTFHRLLMYSQQYLYLLNETTLLLFIVRFHLFMLFIEKTYD